MTVRKSRDPFGEDVRREASDWFGRMRGPRADVLRSEFEAWRVADPANAEAYERVLQHWDRTAFLKNTGLARDRNLDRFDRRTTRRRYAAAACAAVVSLGAVSVYMIEAPSALSAKSLHLQIVTGVEEQRVVSLDDETRVTVEARSKLELLFTPQARRAKLSLGRARFEVPRPDPRPLEVEAGLSRVVAEQASFDVAVTPDRTTVSALRGSVSVTSTDASSTSQRLQPGQEVTLPRATIGSGLPPKPTSDRTPAMLSFQAEAVGSAVERFNRTSGSKIVLLDGAMRQRHVSGAFRIDDPLEFARALIAMFGGTIELSGPNLITISPGVAPSTK